jgi:hypothetical protein
MSATESEDGKWIHYTKPTMLNKPNNTLIMKGKERPFHDKRIQVLT